MLSTEEFARRAALAAVITVLVAGLVALVAFSIHTWFAAYLGVLLAIFIRTLSDWLNRWTGLPPRWAVAVTLIGLIVLLGLVGWWLAKPLTQEAQELQQRIPGAITNVQAKLHAAGLDQFLPNSLADSSRIVGSSSKIVTGVMGIFSGTLQSLITALVVLFLGIYLAFSPGTYINGLLSLLPMSKRHSGRQILGEAGHKLRLWIIGQIISMTVVGVLIGLGLLIVGIPVPLVIGVVAGLLDIIPIFGPIVAAIPAILLGFTVTPMHALYAVLVFIAVNQAESHLLVPLIQRYSVLLPPALTVFALLLMGSLFGFWGLLLAAPITATLLVFIKRIYSEPVLHDPAVTQHD